MTSRHDDLRDCLTAYDCRDRLPELSAWMSDDALKQIPIWRGNRFERGRTYFDLDNPERGPFVATGDEGLPSDHTYTQREQVPEQIWAQLITWRQPISPDQARAIESTVGDFGIEPEPGGPGAGGPYAAG